jgi:protein involved in polysaccharide export with SLBB domain
VGLVTHGPLSSTYAPLIQGVQSQSKPNITRNMSTLPLIQRLLRTRLLIAIAIAVVALPSALRAQANMSAQEIAEKIKASGLSPDQVRGRLKSSGYGETLLDAYMGGGASLPGQVTPPPGADVVAAVTALGAVNRSEQAASTQLAARPAEVDSAPTKENGLPVFGLDVFRRSTTQFEPSVAGPVDANYRLGPNDMLALILTGQVEKSYTLDVTREGFVVIPVVGQVFVANLTLEIATRAIVQKLRQSYANAGTEPTAPTRVIVSVGRLRTNQIFVLGDVVVPASYQVSSAGTALTALYAAGGPTINGNLRNIQVKRAGRVISTLDVYDYLVRGDASHDVRLESGDVVFVSQRSKRVAITGEIRRAGLYDIKAGESLADLVVAAGGLQATAASRRMQVSRILPPAQRREGRDRVVQDVPMDPESNQVANFPLQDGDRVSVFGIVERVRDRVEIVGSVWSPGFVAYRPGMRLSDAIREAGGARPNTYKDQILISRLMPNERREMVRTRLDSLGRPVPDLELRDADWIKLFEESVFRTERPVMLAGSVRSPGKFDYSQHMTLGDLVTMGGGVEEGTDVIDSVIVSRLQSDMTRRVFTVPLRDAKGFTSFPLESGDSVRVSSRSDFRPVRIVTIGGDVNKTSVVPFQAGMTLRQAILAAGGLKESALITEVEISRFPPDRANGKTALVFRVPIDSTYLFERGADGKYLGPPGLPSRVTQAPDFVLEPYDHINVLQQPDWELPGTVTLRGEVRFPGTYAIKHRNETLTDIISRAGGLTDRAYPDGIDFRREIPAAERSERQRMLDRVRKDRSYAMSVERIQVSAAASAKPTGVADLTAAIGSQEASLAAILQSESETTERIGIDLPAVLRDKGRPDNLKLRARDSIYIPAYTPTVTIRGFVNTPTAVLYKPGADLGYYIKAAGGATSNGDPARSFVQQPNGKVDAVVNRRFAPDGQPNPKAGAVVVVPAINPKIETSPMSSAALISAMAGIATAAAALIQITKR